MDFFPTAACTLVSPRPRFGRVAARWLASLVVPLTMLLGACATPAPPIDTPGLVPDANQAVSCPHGTMIAGGQTQGRLSAVWCERPDGRRHGPYVEWWESHQKKSAGLYQDGTRQGVWTFFGPSGQRDSQVEYRNGQAVTAP